ADRLERARRARPGSPRLARRLRDVYAASGRWTDAAALQGEIVLRIHDAPTLAAEEQAMRGLRYQAALAETDPGRAARLLVGLAREDTGFVPAWVSAGTYSCAPAAGWPRAACGSGGRGGGRRSCCSNGSSV